MTKKKKENHKTLFPTSPMSNILYLQECEETGNLIVEMNIGIIPVEVNLAIFNKTTYSFTFDQIISPLEFSLVQHSERQYMSTVLLIVIFL